MHSTKVLFISITLAVIAVGVGFFLWQKRGGDDALVEPSSAFAPPVYLSDESPAAIQRPLYLEGVSSGEPARLTAEQKQRITDFKKKILARIASEVPLNSQEKSVLSISISTAAKPAIGAFVVADQSVLQFSDEEVVLIRGALKR